MLNGLNLGSTVPAVLGIAGVGLVASGLVIAFSLARRADGDSIADRLAMVWFVAALAAVVGLTLQVGPGGYGGVLPAQLDPTSRVRLPNARANMLLYLPLGFFAALLWRSKPRPVVWATGLALSLSLATELAQWVLPISRAAEFQDVVFNTLGGLVGGAVGILVERQVRRFR